jgi:hypothetical protein
LDCEGIIFDERGGHLNRPDNSLHKDNIKVSTHRLVHF